MPPVVREVPFQKGDLTVVQVAGAPRLANAQLWRGGAESRWPGVRSVLLLPPLPLGEPQELRADLVLTV